MISKARIKQIHALELRKYRREHQLFVAEGPKLVGDLLQTMQPEYVAALPSWIQQNQDRLHSSQVDSITEDELQRASLLRTPKDVIALFRIQQHPWDDSIPMHHLVLALDGVQDPGNLGTIVRIADWFGIEDILCSLDTVDIYNPKAIQATMGAIARVRIHTVNLPDVIGRMGCPVYGTFLDGEDMYHKTLDDHGIIVMGNEGNGISPQVGALVNERLFIPNYPRERQTSESLNVAIATSIICAEFRRRQP